MESGTCGNCNKEFATLDLFIKHSCKVKKPKKECTRCGEKGHLAEACFAKCDVQGYPIENEITNNN